MELQKRTELAATSVQTRNKKLTQVLQNSEYFVKSFQLLRNELGSSEKSFHQPAEEEMVEGRDISVCVRVRPLMSHETEVGFFESVHAHHPSVHTLEPKFDVRGSAKTITTKFDADFIFGPEHQNDEIYTTAILPLVELGLKGGVCTVLAYGQTGSGKTFTISGILDRIGFDLFKQRNPDTIRIRVSLFELLGTQASDLLDEARGNKIEILEDKFGKIQLKGANEIELQSAEHFVQLVRQGFAHRHTETTFKNDTSSRSHAICCFRIENVILKEAEDGKIFVVDLAGSENAADAQFHDPGRIKETQQINKSLMSLKDCIRNRALSALNLDNFYHVPYRQSRLTMLMKDAFEVESHRHCKTVVFANVSPSVADLSMTLNTLRYATPLKIGQTCRQKVEPDIDNPATWSNATLRQWVASTSNGKIDPEILCQYESGTQLLRLPETEFLERVMRSNPKIGEKKAKVFYNSLWKLLIDARTRERKKKLQPKNGISFKEKHKRMDQEFYNELIKRETENSEAYNIRN